LLGGAHPVPEYVPQGVDGKPGVAGDVSLLSQAPRRSAVAERTAAGQRRMPRT
jgi:hypothetical protein